MLAPRRRIFRKELRGRARLPNLLLVLGGGIALLLVWWVQDVMGIAPCALCLWERWPWRVVLLLGVVGLLLPHRAARVAAWLATIPLVVDMALSVLHAGVEWKFWPSPLPECLAPHLRGGTMAERLASMPLHPSKPCDAPTYLFDGLPVSLTVMEGLAALGLLGMLVVSLLARPGDRTAD